MFCSDHLCPALLCSILLCYQMIYWIVLNAIACLGSQTPDLGRATNILPLCWDGVTTLDDLEKHC